MFPKDRAVLQGLKESEDVCDEQPAQFLASRKEEDWAWPPWSNPRAPVFLCDLGQSQEKLSSFAKGDSSSGGETAPPFPQFLVMEARVKE